jgi:hypothetical protein
MPDRGNDAHHGFEAKVHSGIDGEHEVPRRSRGATSCRIAATTRTTASGERQERH